MTGSEAQRAFLVEAFAHAQTLANMGLSNMAEGQSADATQAFEWLYGTTDVPMMRAAARLSLEGISQNASPVQGEPQGGDFETADVRVYCTHDRLREGTARAGGETRFFDTVTKEFLRAKFDCTRAMAWTIVPAEDQYPDTLQFCPWFLDYAMKQTAQFQGQFKPGKIGSMISKLRLDRLTTWALYTPIDLFQLFDKVIVHELAHTRRGGEMDDVGGFSGYGWKNCRALSTQRGETSPHTNADSLALYASISALIRDGGMVREDGTFAKDPGGAGGADEGNEGEAVTKSGAEIPDENSEPEPFLEPLAVRRQVLQFNPSSLKGRPLF